MAPGVGCSAWFGVLRFVGCPPTLGIPDTTIGISTSFVSSTGSRYDPKCGPSRSGGLLDSWPGRSAAANGDAD